MKLPNLKKTIANFALNKLEKELKSLTKDWDEIETDHTLLYFLQDRDLDNFKENMISQDEQEYKINVLKQEPITIDKAVDDLFQQVQETLNMYPKMKKLNVYIFENQDSLNRMYQQIRPPNSKCNKIVNGCYSSRRNAVFVPAELEDDNPTKVKVVLGHELTHAVVDNHLKKSLKSSLPEVTEEILANYVGDVIDGKAEKITLGYYEE